MASPWGALAWWIIVFISIPFAFYAGVYVYGDFDVYKTMTRAWQMKQYDIAGLNILHHLRAWQIHSVAAEVFICTGPFQFSPSFRAKFPAIHRVFGYAFVAAATVISVSGIVFLIPNSEFRLSGNTVFAIQGVFMLYFLAVAVKTVKEKKFRVHQPYMIRGAATGYAVIGVRILPGFFMAAGLSFPIALECSAISAPIVFLGLAELYIRMVLLKRKEPTISDDVKYVQTASTEEVKAIKDPVPEGEDDAKLVDNKGDDDAKFVDSKD